MLTWYKGERGSPSDKLLQLNCYDADKHYCEQEPIQNVPLMCFRELAKKKGLRGATLQAY